MTLRLVPVVEGHGEVEAFPVLLRKILQSLAPQLYVEVRRPIHTPRDRFLNREDERRKILGYATLACSEAPGGGHILVLLDADDDCPVTLGLRLVELCERVVRGRVPVSIVLANREYEAWFLASCDTLEGVRDFRMERLRQRWDPSAEDADPDVPRNAKGLMGRATGRAYGETADQAALSSRIDVELARSRSRSFAKLVRECERMLGVDRRRVGDQP